LNRKKIHIVSFDVPFPADYGGVIDVFYRLKSLSELGYEVHLHTYEYGRGEQTELTNYATVYYYKRTRSFKHVLSKRPFIVQSRKNKELMNNLQKDNAPIIFEGIHTTYFLEDPRIQQRLTFVRMHNIEHQYYYELAQKSSFFKRWFYFLEAYKLKKYQHILSNASTIFAVKSSDIAELKKFNERVVLLPVQILSLHRIDNDIKPYALFHGNLSVPENENAALWIIDTLKNELDEKFPLIIAGKNPSNNLIEVCNGKSIQLIANPTHSEMNDLLIHAHIHVLYTAVPAGVKHKLIACIQSSGHILVNQNMIPEKAFNSFCIIQNTPEEYKNAFLQLKLQKLTLEKFENRKKFIAEFYNNHSSVEIITNLLERGAV
jgi:hypothetical protein